MNEKISVVIPVFNVQLYLKDCLESIASQTYQNFEAICVNDGSTDQSLEILQAFAQKDDHFMVVTKPNGGLSDARNYGLKYVTGKYVCFVDSDDCISSTYLEDLYTALQEDHVQIAVCDMEYFYEDGHCAYSDGGTFQIDSAKNTPELIKINNSACNKLFDIALFDDICFPKGLYYEDLATVPILLLKAQKIAKVNRPLYRYRQRTGSIAHTASKKIFEIYTAIQMVLDYANQIGAPTDVIKAIKSMFIVHGLDLTTLRIKDFDDKTIRIEYLQDNMNYLEKYYPNYEQDLEYKKLPFKKKLIAKLTKYRAFKLVLRLYDKN